MAKGPSRSPSPDKIRPAVNRSAASSTIRANCLVGTAAPVATGELAFDSLNVTGIAAPMFPVLGAIQHSCAVGDQADIYTGGEVVLESDGTAVIAVGDLLQAVAGATLAASGRVAPVPSPLVAGVNYVTVGRARTAATNVAGTELVVDYHFEVIQG